MALHGVALKDLLGRMVRYQIVLARTSFLRQCLSSRVYGIKYKRHVYGMIVLA